MKFILLVIAFYMISFPNPATATPCERNPALCNGGGGGNQLKKSVSNDFRALRTYLQQLEQNVQAVTRKWEETLTALKAVKRDLDTCRAAQKTP